MTRTKRIGAAVLAMVMMGDVVVPTAVFALSSGPSQPEVQGFQPAGVNDMVDLFTGDFSYNIPLLDVEGYPVNLFYSAGIGMEQEASWVGLGWNLNPGVVERNLRGLPDDFRGDEIVRDMSVRPNRTFGLSFGVGLQLFGLNSVGLNAGVSPSFNNYDGPQFETNFSLSMRSTLGANSTMTAGLGLSSHSNSGLRVRPTIGFDRTMGKAGKEMSPGLNFGLALDSRQGMTNMSVGATLNSSKSYERLTKSGRKKDKFKIGHTFDLGSPTYTPQVTLPMENLSVSFDFTGGLALLGGHPNMTLGAFFSRQQLLTKTIQAPAFGYLHLDAGQDNPKAMLDFNREKDGPYSPDKAGLGIAALTNDVFSVSGQGISGSYRAFRSEVGHVFDPATGCTGSGGSYGFEVGVPFIAHIGGNIMVNSSNTVSGPWTDGNQAGQRLRFRDLANRPDLEPVFFREANEPTVEQDASLWENMGKEQALMFTLPDVGVYANALGAQLTASGISPLEIPQVNHRQKREPRAQLFSYLDHRTADKFALQKPGSQAGIAIEAPGHHMSEVSITGKDGRRYVYGLPAYNNFQKDVEFNANVQTQDASLITYIEEDAGISNTNGKDHYYSCSKIPPYAYAFLLTAVLSSDYSDVDADLDPPSGPPDDEDPNRGPSDGDLGSYTRFTYRQKHSDFPWRTPATTVADRARWSKGLLSTVRDDKASYTYGEKEVYHLRTIEGRNMIAVFELDTDLGAPERKDAGGVKEDGTLDITYRSSYLKRISLYRRVPGYSVDQYSTEVPIKRVNFEYTNELCPGSPNAVDGAGKLTLKKVWFSYGGSQLGVTTPYEFTYHPGPAYAMDAQDRWGNYKEQPLGLNNDLFPYSEQGFVGDDPEQPALADVYASAWNLATITTPSGGKIMVNYEADDYAWVQNKPAMRMLRLKAFHEEGGGETDVLEQGRRLVFDLPAEVREAAPGLQAQMVDRMFEGIEDLYFRVMVELADDDDWPTPFGRPPFDLVSGYAKIDGHGVDGDEGWVQLQAVQLDEGAGPEVNPIFRAGLEFARLHFPDRINPGAPEYDGDNLGQAALNAFISSVGSFVTGIGEFFVTPNAKLRGKGWCPSADAERSWIRVNEPDRIKKGGGYRVRSLRIADQWNEMEALENPKAFTYGQDYAYWGESGSFGVAAYEPMSGADENPWRQPVYGTKPTPPLVPDERFYQETPFGESLFPGPVVGYSRVIVTDHFPSEEARSGQGTGRVVHEFHTAFDFPTITSRTHAQPAPQGNQQGVNPMAILGFKRVDHMHMSQGYLVETNDMHGKPKRVAVFPEGSDEAITETIYDYVTSEDGRLSNRATVIDPYGNISQAEIGRQYEFVADMRSFSTYSSSSGTEPNMEALLALFFPLPPIPIILPVFSSQSVRFRSGVLVKKVHRFGLLHSVTRIDNGSKVITENLAYDSETGNVLVTKVTNAFEDPIYTMNFPAYWHYPGMGPAYRNINAFATLSIANGGLANIANAEALFYPGDELALVEDGTYKRGWVDHVEGGQIHVIDDLGADINVGVWQARVIRSGRRNMQDAHMMSLTLLSDPLQGLAGNVYEHIVQAQVQEFGGDWATECACLDPTGLNNPWISNQKGVWRSWRDRVWLTERTRSILNNNTDIRRDGVYSSFNPFYKVVNGQWQKDEAGWTKAREVTHYNARGQELENKDALGLFTSADFGFGGTLAKAVARNTRYSELFSENFEEPITEDCTTRWKFEAPLGITGTLAHTGRRSVRASKDDPAEVSADIMFCPPPGCDLGLIRHWGYLTPYGPGLFFTATSGTPPYSFTWEILSGNDDCYFEQVGETTVRLIGTLYPLIVNVTVVDGNGCIATSTWTDI